MNCLFLCHVKNTFLLRIIKGKENVEISRSFNGSTIFVAFVFLVERVLGFDWICFHFYMLHRRHPGLKSNQYFKPIIEIV